MLVVLPTSVLPLGRQVSIILSLTAFGWVPKVISGEDNRAFHMICFQPPSRCRIIWKDTQKSSVYFYPELSFLVSTHFEGRESLVFFSCYDISVFLFFFLLSGWTSSQQSWKKKTILDRGGHDGKKPEEGREAQHTKKQKSGCPVAIWVFKEETCSNGWFCYFRANRNPRSICGCSRSASTM